MHQSRGQKDARWKGRLPVVETSVEISRSKLRQHSRKPKTFRIEIRPRDCHRPTNTGSGSANDLETSCAPHRRTLAAPTTHNRHSKKRADCARGGLDRKQRRVIRRKARQESPYAWSADETFKKENVERPTPNAQRRTRNRRASFGILFSRPDTSHENPDQLFDFIQTGYKLRR